MMLAIYEGDGEVLVCAVDSVGTPDVGDYFKEGEGRVKEDYDLRLVEPPILITSELKADPERDLTR